MNQQLRKMLLLSGFFMATASSGFAQEEDCTDFRIEGARLVLESETKGFTQAYLSEFLDSLDAGEILLVNFPASELCVNFQGQDAVTETVWTSMILNSSINEVALLGMIDGSYEIPLRIDLDYPSELLLERTVGEDIGLTEMEFLSDNSGVGAEDFFSEEIGFLEIGATELPGLFAEVPRYGISYEHYDGVNVESLENPDLSRGSLGMDALRDYVLALDAKGAKAALFKP